jgi:hypothetical protein
MAALQVKLLQGFLGEKHAAKIARARLLLGVLARLRCRRSQKVFRDVTCELVSQSDDRGDDRKKSKNEKADRRAKPQSSKTSNYSN